MLGGLLDAAAAGHGGTAVVAGPVAVGKSTLLDDFATAAAEAGALVLAGLGSESESDLPMGVISQLVLGAPLPAAERERINRLIESAAPGAAETDPPRWARLSGGEARIVHALCTTLLGQRGPRPLAIVVDDVHLADAGSLACLAYLARRVRNAPVAVVFGCSDQPSARRALDLHLELQRQPHGRTVGLRPFGPAGVARAVAARFGEPEAHRIAGRCFELTGGNPLLLGALLDDHAAALECRAPAPPLAAAAHYGRAVLSCVRRGSAPMGQVAQALAVLGEPGGVARLLDLDAEPAARALSALTACGLLHEGRFRDPAARSAILRDLAPAVRADLNRRAAQFAYCDGRPARVAAGHLLAAGGGGGPWAVQVLDEAARLALSEGRVSDAVGFLDLACTLCEDDGERARMKAALLRAQWRVNPSASARHLDGLVTSMEAGHLRGSDALTLVKALLWHGRAGAARAVLARLGEPSPDADADGNGSGGGDVGAAADPAIVAELHLTRPWLRCSYPELAPCLPSQAPDADGVAGIPATIEASRRLDAAAAVESVLTRGPSARTLDEAERILRGARLEGIGMDTAECALLALLYAECPERAAPWCEELLEEANGREAPSRLARLRAIRAEISLRLGDLPGARRHALEAFATVPPDGWGVTVGAPLASLLIALTAMGRHDDAAARLSLPVSDAMLHSRFGLHYLQARGRYRLATGDPGGALADFQVCGELMGRWNLDAPGPFAWRNDVAEALLSLGEPERAAGLLEEQLRRCGAQTLPRTFASALRLLAATRVPRQRPALLRQATNLLQTGDRYELCRSLADLADAYHVLGESRRGRMVGHQALAVARECAAEPLCRRLTADGGRPEVEPVAPGVVLSDAEQRVADLVGLGHTNREIAKRLFITVSTVEQHLTRAYRKLGVVRREDLVSALSAVPAPRERQPSVSAPTTASPTTAAAVAASMVPASTAATASH